MKDDTKYWLSYASDNLEAAAVLLDSNLFNPCLQNVQQCVEKSMKAVIVEFALRLRKSHRISELKEILRPSNIVIDITEDECELLDSIYLPSKYPVGSVLPDFYPDEKVCRDCIAIAKKVFQQAGTLVAYL
ncbi:MAG: HEPN domain-containing protein [Ignavibacteriales bacterium]|nr:HEPN domain-containing protein [Ignavibacteriales bacterium]